MVVECSLHLTARPLAQKCSTRQISHVWESVGLYRPFWHVVHVLEPLTETCQSSQDLHDAFDVAPTVAENVSAEQFSHAATPGTILYLPATHRVHGPPSNPDDPGWQMQSVSLSLASNESEFDGQTLHTSEELPPTIEEY